MDDRSSDHAYSKGYALRTPRGTILPHTFRRTPAEAVAAIFAEKEIAEGLWDAARNEGMTCDLVYARVFVPRFFPSVAPKADETTGAE